MKIKSFFLTSLITGLLIILFTGCSAPLVGTGQAGNISSSQNNSSENNNISYDEIPVESAKDTVNIQYTLDPTFAGDSPFFSAPTFYFGGTNNIIDPLQNFLGVEIEAKNIMPPNDVYQIEQMICYLADITATVTPLDTARSLFDVSISGNYIGNFCNEYYAGRMLVSGQMEYYDAQTGVVQFDRIILGDTIYDSRSTGSNSIDKGCSYLADMIRCNQRIEEMQSYDYNGWYSEWDSKYRDLVSKHDMNFHLGTEYGEFLEWKANTPQEDLDEIYGLTEAKRLADEMGGALGSDPQ